MEKELFDAVEKIGEVLNGAYHILDISEEYPIDPRDKTFRVYHSKGYCFDVSRECVFDDETDDFKGFEYNVFDEYEDFLKGSNVLYYKLLG